MTPNAAILDAEDTMLLHHLDEQWYPHYNENNNVPIPIDFCVIVNCKKVLNFYMIH